MNQAFENDETPATGTDGFDAQELLLPFMIFGEETDLESSLLQVLLREPIGESNAEAQGMDETNTNNGMDATKISTDSNHTSASSDITTQDNSSTPDLVPISPDRPPSVVVTLPDPPAISFRNDYDKNLNTGKVVTFGKSSIILSQLTETNVGNNKTPAIIDEASACETSNVVVVTKPDLTKTSQKNREKKKSDQFHDFPTINGVCLHDKGTKGITKSYRDHRKCLFQKMKCRRTKNGEDFSNELIQTEIIEKMKTSLQLNKIRFFGIEDGELVEYFADTQIFDEIRADFEKNTFTYTGSDNHTEARSMNKVKTKHPSHCQKQLGNLLQLNQIELDEASDIDPGKKMIYRGVMRKIYDAFARRMLDEDCEAELYEWCEMSFAYLFCNEMNWDNDFVTKSLCKKELTESTRLQLKQKGGNPCKKIIFEGILNDIGYAAFEDLFWIDTKDELRIWVEMTWNFFFEKGNDKKRTNVLISMNDDDYDNATYDQDDKDNDHDDKSNGHYKKKAAKGNKSSSASRTDLSAGKKCSDNVKSSASPISNSIHMNSMASQEEDEATFLLPVRPIIDAKNTWTPYASANADQDSTNKDHDKKTTLTFKAFPSPKAQLSGSFIGSVRSRATETTTAASTRSGSSNMTKFSQSSYETLTLPDGRIMDCKNTLQSFDPQATLRLQTGRPKVINIVDDNVIHANAVEAPSVPVVEGVALKASNPWSQMILQFQKLRIKRRRRPTMCTSQGK